MNLTKCEDKHNLPSLGFIFKGYTKDGKDDAFELILTPDDYVLEFEVNGRSDCVIGIGSDNEDSGWTLGQVFLRAYYTVFDRESEAVGFVKSNSDPGNSPEEIINKDAMKLQTISNYNVQSMTPTTVTPMQTQLPALQLGLTNGPLPYSNIYSAFTSFLNTELDEGGLKQLNNLNKK
jgi:hypothetical protein